MFRKNKNADILVSSSRDGGGGTGNVDNEYDDRTQAGSYDAENFEPQLQQLKEQTQLIVPLPGQEMEKQNPLYHSVTSKQSTHSESGVEDQEQLSQQEILEHSQSSVIKSSDFVQSTS